MTDTRMKRSEDWNSLITLSPNLMCVSDLETRILAVNPAWRKVTGWDDWLLNRSALDLVHPDDRSYTEREIDRLRDGLEPVTLVNRYQCSDGSYKWFTWDCVAAPEENRIYSTGREVAEPRAALAVRREIETQRATESALRQAYQTLNGIIEASPHAIIAVDANRKVRLWNPAASQIFGWTDEEVIGRAVPFVSADQKNASELFNTRVLLRGESLTNFALQRTRRNGSLVDLLVSAAPTHDDNGAIDGFLTVATDVTEYKKVEQQFLRTQRLESLGTLASGIAHDLNNVLSPISMSIELFRTKTPDPSMDRTVQTLQNCVKRASDLIRQILTFARGVQGERVPVQTLHLMRDMQKVISQTLPKTITMSVDIPKNLRHVSADATQLHQVLMNLCINSRDAMTEGGTLIVSASNVDIDDAYLKMAHAPSQGPHICIEVKDTGCGIKQELREKVFEPFFTTKEIGKGTGLGLSTVAAIVKSHGGFIELSSEVGRGTSFKVYLPALSSATEQSTSCSSTRLPSGSGEVVLVVDDEAAVREIARLTLETHGYRVLEAQDGADGVARYAEHVQEIRLVISDMDMPIMNGAAMIRSLERITPEVRVISASGLGTSGPHSGAGGHPHRRLLPKPYTAEQLLRTVHELLHAA